MIRTLKRIIFVVLLIILVAGVLPWALVRLGNVLFAGSAEQARLVWTAAQFTSFYDRDIIYYNIGNASYKESNYDAAATAYQSADDVAQPKNRCPIRYNWGLTLMDKGDHSTDRNSARIAYSEALRVISLQACQIDPAYKTQFEELYNELLKRLKAVNEPQQGENSNQDQPDSQEAEEAAKDNSKEKASAKDYENYRRFHENRDSSGNSQSRFVW